MSRAVASILYVAAAITAGGVEAGVCAALGVVCVTFLSMSERKKS